MTIDTILSRIIRETEATQAELRKLKTQVVLAPLNAGPTIESTIAAGAIAATRPHISLIPQSGTADDLDTINNPHDGKVVVLSALDSGDTITVRDVSVSITGNIRMRDGANKILSNQGDSLALMYKESTGYWEQIAASGSSLVETFLELTDTPAAYTGAGGQFVKVKVAEDGLEFVAGSGGAVDSVNGQTGVVVLDTDDIAEGVVNFYFTDERAQDAVGLILTDSTTIDFTYDDVTPTITAIVIDDSIDNTKLANMAANTVKTNNTGSVADPADVDATTFLAQYIDGATDKPTPVDADTFPTIDSEASNVLKKVSWANIKATLKTYLDTLYLVLLGKAGGQTASGGTAASENLIFDSTVHATKGVIGLQPSGGHVGIGTSTPGVDVVGTTDITAAPILQVSGATPRFVLHGSASAGAHLIDAGATADLKWLRVVTDGGLTKFASLNDTGLVRVDNILVLDHNLGYIGIGTSTPGTDVVGTFDITNVPLLQLDGATPRMVIRGSTDAGLDLIDTGAGANLKWMRLINDAGFTEFQSINDSGAVQADNILVLDHNLGQVGVNTATLAAGAALTMGGDLATAVLRAVDAAGLGIEDDGGVVALFIQDGGNLGVRTTDIEATAANYATIQLGGLPAIIFRSDTGDDFSIANNAYYDGAWKRRVSGKPSKISMAGGLTTLSVGSSDGPDSAITWVDVLKFSDSAKVGIGAPSNPDVKLHVSNGAYGGVPLASVVILAEDDADAGITIGTPNTNKGTLWFADNNANDRGALQYDHATDSMIFRVAAADVASFDSAGVMTYTNNVIAARTSGTTTIRAASQVATTGIGSMQAFSDAVDLRFQAYGSAVAGTRGGQAFANAGEFVVATGDKFLITVVPNAPLHLLTNSAVRMTITGGGDVGIGEITPTGRLHVEQASLTGAIPTLWLRQADLSEEFIRFEATVAAGNPINTTALGAYYGRVRVFVDGVGAKWMPLYN